ncbi:site-specific DNA-methyltransferase [Campylobacter troglodytis]|uniref:site-specific DNA-methyltransferase n=1 Tax=Campylobacter troglodytis TaxID=654363 RepID=UPI00115B61FD|nr:site-specific DNA-methyltransferase [Campylobacter troglodytis]TQR59632.1 restriction endonuclease [Campylobacter troglodytis]
MQRLPTNTLITQDYAHNKLAQNAHSKNVLIKGDNLEVLKHLKNAYYRKIKMIYIDPPYNTGKDFVYNDERDFTPQSLANMADISEDEAENILSKTLNKASSHSAWLSFMYPRLYLARSLLRDDGVIFISIDDNEEANLKLLCDNIFGEGNFVSCFVWQKKSGGGQAKYFYEGHEYVLIYAKDKSLLKGLFKVKEKSSIETDFLRKIHGKYTNNPKLRNIYEKYPNELINHRNLMFEEMDIFLKEKLISQEKYDEIKEKLANGTYFLKPYNDKFNLVCRYSGGNQSLMYSIISGVWTSDGNTENEEIFGANVFKDPKPVDLIKRLLGVSTIPNSPEFNGGGGATLPILRIA